MAKSPHSDEPPESSKASELPPTPEEMGFADVRRHPLHRLTRLTEYLASVGRQAWSRMPSSWRRRLHRHWRGISAVGLAGVFVLVLFAARWMLFKLGYLAGEEQLLFSNVFIAAVVLMVGSSIYLAARRREAAAEPESPVGAFSVLAGAAVAVYTLTELAAPLTPEDAIVPACRNAPAYGAKFTAMTSEQGISVREGPGRTYPQTNRYGPECTIGFEGMCLGEPWLDSLIGTYDQRWFIVHNREDELVPAGALITQGSEPAIGTRPHEECTRYLDKRGDLGAGAKLADTRPVLEDLKITPETDEQGAQWLSVDARNTVLLGYAYASGNMTMPRPITDFEWGQAQTDAGFYVEVHDGFTTRWFAKSTHALLGRDATVAVAAVPCLAGNVPDGERALFAQTEVTAERLVSMRPVSADSIDENRRDLLIQAACARRPPELQPELLPSPLPSGPTA